MLGLRFDGHSFDYRFLICDIRTDLPGWESERREVASGGRDARIRAVIGDRPYEVVWSSVYRFQSRVVDRMRAGRVLLAGDVAHLVSPFGARGLNSGVQDAENAAWKLAFVLNGWAGEELLDSYHAERHSSALENLDVTGATMRFLVPGSEEEHRVRVSALEAAATDPAARAAVDSGRLAEPFWYVDSPLTTSDPSRPFTGRPPRGAVPPPAPGELWIVRPDAHVAAVLARPAPADVTAALHRALGVPGSVRGMKGSISVSPKGM